MTPTDLETSLLIRRALRAATLSFTDIAQRVGVSYDAVRSWSIGRSVPRAANAAALATLLDEQADVLRGIALELRERKADAPVSPEDVSDG